MRIDSAKEIAYIPVSYTHLEVYKRQVPEFCAAIPHQLKSFIGISFFYVRSGLDLVYASYWTFQDIVLVLQPREEAGQYSTDVINRHFA